MNFNFFDEDDYLERPNSLQQLKNEKDVDIFACQSNQDVHINNEVAEKKLIQEASEDEVGIDLVAINKNMESIDLKKGNQSQTTKQ